MNNVMLSFFLLPASLCKFKYFLTFAYISDQVRQCGHEENGI